MTRRAFLRAQLRRLTRSADGTMLRDDGDAFELSGPLTETGAPGEGYFAIGQALALSTPFDSAVRTRLLPRVGRIVYLRVADTPRGVR